MKSPHLDFSQHVKHPRYGRYPRVTGLDPNPDARGVHLHWNARIWTPRQRRQIQKTLGWDPFTFPHDGTTAIQGTALEADLTRQTSWNPVTHYYDLDKVCRDCRRPFIFFAVEQKHWYEKLQFPLEADAVRCSECRKKSQVISRKRKRYDALVLLKSRSHEQSIELADCCLWLVKEGVFQRQSLQKVREVANRLGKSPTAMRLRERLREIEADVGASN